MHFIIQGVKIIDPTSPFNQLVKDIRIHNGRIIEIDDRLHGADDEDIFDFTGKFVSPGWFDMMASFGDPGHEHKETIQSGANAATYGGFTSVCLMPNTIPALHSKSEIEYIINRSKSELINIYPYGAITKKREGSELTEIYDMHHAGAIAFTDADVAVNDGGILMRSLLYVKPFGGVIINIPNNHSEVGNASVNEGNMSVQLGMYGIPEVLEEIMVIRDIKLAEYTQSKLHLGIISSAASLNHIREAKNKGIHVTAGVSAYQIYFDESELHDYNTNYKVNPPLRTKQDVEAIKAGLKDGTIDVICSYHLPHESDVKDVEFENAAFGMESIEATFGAANSMLKEMMSIEEIINKIAINPRKILNIAIPSIDKNNLAELTIFDGSTEWQFGKEHLKGRSNNTGFTGKTLNGKPLAIINKSRIKIL
ncbi:MAG: dihydroorotase family protein [Chitinophagales bacterium]